jgi:hypothetical protein
MTVDPAKLDAIQQVDKDAVQTSAQINSMLHITSRQAQNLKAKFARERPGTDNTTTTGSDHPAVTASLFTPSNTAQQDDKLRDTIVPLILEGATVVQFCSRVPLYTNTDSKGSPMVLLHMTDHDGLVVSYDISDFNVHKMYPHDLEAWSILEYLTKAATRDQWTVPASFNRMHHSTVATAWMTDNKTWVRTEMVCWGYTSNLLRAMRAMEVKDLDDTHNVCSNTFKLIRLVGVDANHRTVVNLEALTRHVSNRTTTWFYSRAYPMFYGRSMRRHVTTLSDGAGSLISNIESQKNTMESRLLGPRRRAMCRWHATTKVYQTTYGFQWRLLDGGIGDTVYAWIQAALYSTLTIDAVERSFESLRDYITQRNPVPAGSKARNSALAASKRNARTATSSTTTVTDGEQLVHMNEEQLNADNITNITACVLRVATTKGTFFKVTWDGRQPVNADHVGSANSNTLSTIECEDTMRACTANNPQLRAQLDTLKRTPMFETVSTMKDEAVCRSSVEDLRQLMSSISLPGPKHTLLHQQDEDDNDDNEDDYIMWNIESLVERHVVGKTGEVIWRVQWENCTGGDTYEPERHLLTYLDSVAFNVLVTTYQNEVSRKNVNKRDIPVATGDGMGLTPIRRHALEQYIDDMYKQRYNLAPVYRDQNGMRMCTTCNQPTIDETERSNGPHFLDGTCTRSEVSFASLKRSKSHGVNTSAPQLVQFISSMATKSKRDHSYDKGVEMVSRRSFAAGGVNGQLDTQLTTTASKYLRSRIALAANIILVQCKCVHCRCDATLVTWRSSRRNRRAYTAQELQRSPWLQSTRHHEREVVTLSPISKLLYCTCPYRSRYGTPCEHIIALLTPDAITLDDMDIRFGARVHGGEEDARLWAQFSKDPPQIGFPLRGRTISQRDHCQGKCSVVAPDEHPAMLHVLDPSSAMEDSPKKASLYSQLQELMTSVIGMVNTSEDPTSFSRVALSTIEDAVSKLDSLSNVARVSAADNGATIPERTRHKTKSKDKREYHAGDRRSPTKKPRTTTNDM